MAVSAAQFNELKADVECHEKFINGNGVLGAKTRIKTLEDTSARIEKKLDQIGLAIWGIFAAVTGGVLIWAITKLIPAIITVVGKV